MAYWLLTCIHECIHLAAACAVGHFRPALTASNLASATMSKRVHVPGASGRQAAFIRHAGWVGSVLAALVLSWSNSMPALGAFSPQYKIAAWLTALDAVMSDLLGVCASSHPDVFHCGNFGLVILSKEHRDKVLEILKEMVRITMMRGAQSGGVITYVKQGQNSFRGIRSRVVNGKRTNLSELVVSKLASDLRFVSLPDAPRIFAGHTRFATTSKATFDGTHPHQWTPPEMMRVWRRDSEGAWSSEMASVENFICHNGDLDAFDVAGVCHPLEALMPWLAVANHCPAPSQVDSAGVAGLMDLLRCQASVTTSLLLC